MNSLFNSPIMILTKPEKNNFLYIASLVQNDLNCVQISVNCV